jgi:hypothetical protein
VVFAEGIASSLVSVSTSRALIRRASIIGTSIIGALIIGASIIGALIIGTSIIGASRALIANLNIVIKRSYSMSSLDSE